MEFTRELKQYVTVDGVEYRVIRTERYKNAVLDEFGVLVSGDLESTVDRVDNTYEPSFTSSTDS